MCNSRKLLKEFTFTKYFRLYFDKDTFDDFFLHFKYNDNTFMKYLRTYILI